MSEQNKKVSDSLTNTYKYQQRVKGRRFLHDLKKENIRKQRREKELHRRLSFSPFRQGGK